MLVSGRVACRELIYPLPFARVGKCSFAGGYMHRKFLHQRIVAGQPTPPITYPPPPERLVFFRETNGQ